MNELFHRARSARGGPGAQARRGTRWRRRGSAEGPTPPGDFRGECDGASYRDRGRRDAGLRDARLGDRRRLAHAQPFEARGERELLREERARVSIGELVLVSPAPVAQPSGHRAMISVLMPYRDAEATIAEAIDCILAQEGVDLELIAIDDGSTDRSAQIVRSYADPRLRPIESEGGLAIALERGRAVARGSLVARMDADDRCAPTRLAEQRDAIGGAAAIGTQVELFSSGLIGEGMRRYVAWQNAILTPEDHARELFVESPLCHPSVLIKRAALDAVGGWRKNGWPEDYDLWLRLDAAGYTMAKLPRALFSWRVREGSATFTRPEYSLEAFRAVKAAFLAPKLAGHPIAIWGAGPTGRRLARELERHGVRALRFIDIDPRKIGRTARGVSVVSPEEVAYDETILVAVGARGARELVREHLVGRGFVEGRDFVCAA